MFISSELSDELQALKSEMSRLLSTTGDGRFDDTKNRADAIADQIKAAFNELGETLSERDDQVEMLVAEHPVAAMASALALGVVIGFMLRRH